MHPSEQSPAARLIGPLGLIAVALGGIGVLSCVGLPAGMGRSLGPVSVLSAALGAGLMALAYLLGAWGLGRPLTAVLFRGASGRMWIQLGLGLGAMLWVSHLLGVLGLLSGQGATPRVVGWGVVGFGLVMLADQVVRGPLRPERWPVLPVSVMLWGPGLAVVIVAAANPPGSLWNSEYGAFDALSYHLQLPKEWAAGARLWPTDHNVYSYLPSFVEGAYLHLGTMMAGGGGGGAAGGTLDPVQRLLGGEGNWVIACQYLHAGMGIVGALLVGRAAFVMAGRCGTDGRSATVLGVIAGAFVLCTPWVVVVSSLAYNEAGVIAMMGAGVLVVVEGSRAEAGVGVGKIGAAAGLLVGVACGCKPTALFLVGPVVGLLMLGSLPIRAWVRATLAGAVMGVVAISPWMVRNWMASGNPVFPFASTVFGSGRWTLEQVERYSRNHHAPEGITIGERFGRLFSDEFGLRHGQWGIVMVVVGVALVAAVIWGRSRRMAILLACGMGIQCAAWMVLTHLQSRFLLPLIVPAVLLMTLGGGALIAWILRFDGLALGKCHACGYSLVGLTNPKKCPECGVPVAPDLQMQQEQTWGRRPMLVATALAVLALAPLSQALQSVTLFLEQNGGMPNQLLIGGVGTMTGMTWDEEYRAADDVKRAEFAASVGPAQFVNLRIRPQETVDSGVYLLGDSTPLYFVGANGVAPSASRARTSSPVVYHTTWDTPLLIAPAASGAPGDPDWSKSLRGRGIRYVLVNYDELARLIGRSHYYDPAITLEGVARWIGSPEGHLKSVRLWRAPTAPPGTGSELFEIELLGPARAGVVGGRVIPGEKK